MEIDESQRWQWNINWANFQVAAGYDLRQKNNLLKTYGRGTAALKKGGRSHDYLIGTWEYKLALSKSKVNPSSLLSIEFIILLIWSNEYLTRAIKRSSKNPSISRKSSSLIILFCIVIVAEDIVYAETFQYCYLVLIFKAICTALRVGKESI